MYQYRVSSTLCAPALLKVYSQAFNPGFLGRTRLSRHTVTSCLDNHVMQFDEAAVSVVTLLSTVVRLDGKTVGRSCIT